jgi:hypothetical protein
LATDLETTPPPSLEQDPFLYDTDRLHAIAGESVVRQGLAYFKENRVMELDLEENGLFARVEGGRPDFPYTTQLTYEDDGSLYVSCDCGFVEEPVCKHAVAALYHYAAARAGGEESFASAKEGAIEERTQRGRTEVKVRRLSGEPWFGAWRAASVTSTTHRPQSYRVHIRSLSKRSNYCTCPDFAVNQLGIGSKGSGSIDSSGIFYSRNQSSLTPLTYRAQKMSPCSQRRACRQTNYIYT